VLNRKSLIFFASFLVFFLVSSSALHADVANGSSDWAFNDIGGPSIAGVRSDMCGPSAAACSELALVAGGSGIGDAADQFSFLSRPMTGDGVVTIRLETFLGRYMATAGLMLRGSNDPSSPMVAFLATQPGDIVMRRREVTGGIAVETPIGAPSGRWLRLARAGSTVVASTSTDGQNWTVAYSGTLQLPASLLAGAVLASGDAGTAIVVGSDLTMDSASTLPEGWASAGIGETPATGRATFDNQTFFVASAGTGLNANADAFRYVYTPVHGDVRLIARVVAQQGAPSGLAGVMLRTSLDPSAAHESLLTGATEVRRVSRAADRWAATVQSTPLAAPPTWLMLERRGFAIRAFTSVDGTSWTALGVDTWPVDSDVYAGLVVNGSSDGSATAAAFDAVSLTPIAANQAPVVSLTAPGNGQSIVTGGLLTIAATASDPDDRVSYVEFFVNGQSIGVDSTAPYAASWTPSAAGSYVVTAIARDESGATTTSAPVTISASAVADSGAAGSAGTGSAPPPAGGTGGNGVADGSVDWVFNDIGAPSIAGVRSDACGASPCSQLALVAGGTGIGGAADQFSFLSRPLTGDGMITVHLARFLGRNLATAGLMLRGSNDPSSPMVAFLVTQPGEIVVRHRETTGGVAVETPVGLPSGRWLRLARVGSTVVALTSSDGQNWTIAYRGTLQLPDLLSTGVVLAAGDAGTALAVVSDLALTSDASALPAADDGVGGSDGNASIPPLAGGSAPRVWLQFEPSVDHATVLYYVFEVFDAETQAMVALRYVGKPPVGADGRCNVDVGAVLDGLPAGNYEAVVRAVNDGGGTESGPAPFVK